MEVSELLPRSVAAVLHEFPLITLKEVRYAVEERLGLPVDSLKDWRDEIKAIAHNAAVARDRSSSDKPARRQALDDSLECKFDRLCLSLQLATHNSRMQSSRGRALLRGQSLDEFCKRQCQQSMMLADTSLATRLAHPSMATPPRSYEMTITPGSQLRRARFVGTPRARRVHGT